jgi:hypothetical protein
MFFLKQYKSNLILWIYMYVLRAYNVGTQNTFAFIKRPLATWQLIQKGKNVPGIVCWVAISKKSAVRLMASSKIDAFSVPRVTRLGEFWPFGRLFTFESFFVNYKSIKNVWAIFSTTQDFLRHMGWATLWAIFFTNSSGHTVRFPLFANVQWFLLKEPSAAKPTSVCFFYF